MNDEQIEFMKQTNEYVKAKGMFSSSICSPAPTVPLSSSPHYAAGQKSLIYYHGGRVILHYVREPLAGFLPGSKLDFDCHLNDAQITALNVLESLARTHSLTIQSMHKGDLTFLNNFSTLHSREDFKDDDVNARHLVRMRLRDEDLAWKLPKELQNGNDTVFKYNPEDEVWNVLAVPRVDFKIYEVFGP